jgi:hypothetical protein
MIKAEIKSTIKFPKEFITQDDLSIIANNIVIPLLEYGIHSGVGVDGAPFPTPERSGVLSTQRKTQKQLFTKKGNIRATAINKIEASGLIGFAKKILIDTGKLVRSFKSVKSGKYAINVKLAGDRADIGKFLQIDGVRTKHGKKFYNFFGITKGMEADAMAYANKKVNDACNKFNGK